MRQARNLNELSNRYVNALAYRVWTLRRWPVNSALDDWLVAQRWRRKVIREAAYFRWLNRGQPFGDPETDWFGAEVEVVNGHPARNPFVDERLREQVIREAAYFRWLNRGRPFGDPEADWFGAEVEVVDGG
jgi:Protein of unknown function (DUF2934)